MNTDGIMRTLCPSWKNEVSSIYIFKDLEIMVSNVIRNVPVKSSVRIAERLDHYEIPPAADPNFHMGLHTI